MRAREDDRKRHEEGLTIGIMATSTSDEVQLILTLMSYLFTDWLHKDKIRTIVDAFVKNGVGYNIIRMLLEKCGVKVSGVVEPLDYLGLLDELEAHFNKRVAKYNKYLEDIKADLRGAVRRFTNIDKARLETIKLTPDELESMITEINTGFEAIEGILQSNDKVKFTNDIDEDIAVFNALMAVFTKLDVHIKKIHPILVSMYKDIFNIPDDSKGDILVEVIDEENEDKNDIQKQFRIIITILQTMWRRFNKLLHKRLTLQVLKMNADLLILATDVEVLKQITPDKFIELFEQLIGCFGGRHISDEDMEEVQGNKVIEMVMMMDVRVQEGKRRDTSLILPYADSTAVFKNMNVDTISKLLNLFITACEKYNLDQFIHKFEVLQADANYRLPIMRNILIQHCDLDMLTMADDDDIQCDFAYSLYCANWLREHKIDRTISLSLNMGIIEELHNRSDEELAGSPKSNVSYDMEKGVFVKCSMPRISPCNGFWSKMMYLPTLIKHNLSVNPFFTDGEDGFTWQLIEKYNHEYDINVSNCEQFCLDRVKCVYMPASKRCYDRDISKIVDVWGANTYLLLQYIYTRFGIDKLDKILYDSSAWIRDVCESQGDKVIDGFSKLVLPFDMVCGVKCFDFSCDMPQLQEGDHKVYWASVCSDDSEADIEVGVIVAFEMVNYILERQGIELLKVRDVHVSLERLKELRDAINRYVGERVSGIDVVRVVIHPRYDEYDRRLDLISHLSVIVRCKNVPRKCKIVGDVVVDKKGNKFDVDRWNQRMLQECENDLKIRMEILEDKRILEVLERFEIESQIIPCQPVYNEILNTIKYLLEYEYNTDEFSMFYKPIHEDFISLLNEIKKALETEDIKTLLLNLDEFIASYEDFTPSIMHFEQYGSGQMIRDKDRALVSSLLIDVKTLKSDILGLLPDESFAKYLTKSFKPSDFEDILDVHVKSRSSMFAGNRGKVFNIFLLLLVVVIVIVIVVLIVKAIGSKQTIKDSND